MSFFRNFLFLNQLSSNLVQRFKIGLQFSFLAKKVVWGRFRTIWHKTIILCLLFGQTPLWNSVVMATSKVPSNQNLFERECYMLKLKVAKFQLATPDGFWAVLKNQLGANLPSPSKIGLRGSVLRKTQVHFLFSPFSYSEASNLRIIHASFLEKLWRHRQFWITWWRGSRVSALLSPIFRTFCPL